MPDSSQQTIGIPTETKAGEARIALTPQDCQTLINTGVHVHVQAGAGEKAGFPDSAYAAAGCIIRTCPETLYAAAKTIVKVKEPQESDLANLTANHNLFCYLHLAGEPELTEKLKQIGCTAIAFETVVVNGETPLLAPMSAIAGRLATQIGTWHLHEPRGGNGILLGGISNQPDGNVTVIGAGVAGTESALLALGMGAKVTVMDTNQEKLNALHHKYPGIKTMLSNEENINAQLPTTDLLIGAVYVVGKKSPLIVTAQQIKLMPKGSVAVDLSIDQGGCLETSKPCTHANPTYVEHGVIHSAITNLPAAAPHTASTILSAAILPYVEKVAKQDWSEEIYNAVNIAGGDLKIEL